MKLGAVGSNCVDYYENLEGGKAFMNMVLHIS